MRVLVQLQRVNSMMTYTFRVINADNPMKDHEDEGARWKVGDIVSVDLRITEYDEFREETKSYLERYFDTPPAFKFEDSIKAPPGKFMERMDYIRHHYPGAKDMFNGTKWRPAREW